LIYLASFEKWYNYRLQHIKGRERSESQVFLDRFFKAFGHQGVQEAGAKFEEAIKQGSSNLSCI
jgi:hypothetical protein